MHAVGSNAKANYVREVPNHGLRYLLIRLGSIDNIYRISGNRKALFFLRIEHNGLAVLDLDSQPAIGNFIILKAVNHFLGIYIDNIAVFARYINNIIVHVRCFCRFDIALAHHGFRVILNLLEHLFYFFLDTLIDNHFRIAAELRLTIQFADFNNAGSVGLAPNGVSYRVSVPLILAGRKVRLHIAGLVQLVANHAILNAFLQKWLIAAIGRIGYSPNNSKNNG